MIEDIVSANRPQGATVYLLRNGSRVYPTSGAYQLDPFEEPPRLPPGLYSVAYREHAYAHASLPPLVPNEQPPTIRIGDPSVTAVATRHNKGSGAIATRDSGDPLLHNKQHLNDRIGYLRTKMMDENIVSEHLIGKQLVKNSEIGEAFIVAKAWRQEAENVARSRMLLQEDNLRLAKQLQEERLAFPKPAEGNANSFMAFASQLLGLIPALAPALAKRSGIESMLDPTIGESSESQVEREIKAAKQELAEVSQKLAKKNKQRKSDRVAQLEQTIAAAMAELEELKRLNLQRKEKPRSKPRAPKKATTAAPATAKSKKGTRRKPKPKKTVT